LLIGFKSFSLSAQGAYIGTTLDFVGYLENRCGIVFKENGIPADPFKSMANHGATLIRIHVGHPPFSSSYSEGMEVDHHSIENAKLSLQRVREAGLKSLLTFTYKSFALEDSDNLNIYVAPLAWQSIASDLDRIKDSVYQFTYRVLDEYCSEDLIPEIVSIGGESTWHRLMPNVPEEDLPGYDPARSVALHNAGSKAVRDIASKYDTTIKVCFHMRGPTVTKWWLEEHWPYGPDLDMIGISLYYGWNFDDYAGYNSLGEYVEAIIDQYGIEFIVMETAQLFREGGNDSHVDILGTELIPVGYPNPPTTETQKRYLTDITKEVLDHGGSGVLVWGGEWVASDCYIYADPWGKGSSWENKAFWDFDYNLHDGVNWMMVFTGQVPVIFKVDMTGADTSKGVFVRGDFENFNGEAWAFNRMEPEGNHIYAYTTYMSPGTSGTFHFLNDTFQSATETVPVECSGDTGAYRYFEIPGISEGEIITYRWSGCDTIPQYTLTTGTTGKGYTSPTTDIYSEGILVELIATPASGWRFTGWSGDTSSTINPIQILMDSDKVLIANFESIPIVPVTFKVDMTHADVTHGVYVTGDFPNKEGKTWQLNRMSHEGGNIYSYSTDISIGSSGAYYFLNDDQWGVRETVPAACAVHWGSDRGYEIPENSTGETFAYVWSSCQEIETVSIPQGYRFPDSALVDIFPNPIINNQLHFVFRTEDAVTVSLMNMTGKLLLSADLHSRYGNRYSMDVSEIPHGSYLAKIDFRRKKITQYRLMIK